MALIVDTGPLLASLDRSEPEHARCRHLLRLTDEPILIPTPVLVELDYLIRTRPFTGVLLAFLSDVIEEAYSVVDLARDDYVRVRELCDRYADSDIGFGDAAVVSIVARLNEPKIATLDHRHFGIICPRHVEELELLPG